MSAPTAEVAVLQALDFACAPTYDFCSARTEFLVEMNHYRHCAELPCEFRWHPLCRNHAEEALVQVRAIAGNAGMRCHRCHKSFRTGSASELHGRRRAL